MNVPAAPDLPNVLTDWFDSRSWRPRAHQLELLQCAQQGESALLIAPTGGGKTLAGFLPSLVDLVERGPRPPGAPGGLHTLYISPLKALTVDIARNVETPVREMGLDIRLETRTGDTPSSKRARQRSRPPDILLTTPEQLALLLAYSDTRRFFKFLKHVILDELHAIAPTKRGDLLALAMGRLRRFAPEVQYFGLSATVHDPEPLRRFLAPGKEERPASLVLGQGGAQAQVNVLDSEERIPWRGHMARHAYGEIYQAIKSAGMTLVFVNTRSQAELAFQELWALNDDNLPIALHHGSLDVGRRRKVEGAMTRGELRAVVCTSTLDLGIDWGDVDLVIQIGAPKGASRLTQRIGRANHRLDEPSRALLVPSNRFEALECRAAQEAVEAGELDGGPPREGGLDTLAQHILGAACGEPFDIEELYAEVRATAPYADLSRETFDRVVAFVATGGYALATYDRYRRLIQDEDGRYKVRDGRVAQQYRLNVGAIVEAPMLKVRLASARRARGVLRGGRKLGQVEEWFVEQLAPGDTFVFAGEVVRFEGLRETDVFVSRASGADPKVPSWQGGKFPLSTYLADRVRAMISHPKTWANLPQPVQEWLEIQRLRSIIPESDQLLVETFPHRHRFFLVAYPFEGRLAHQTLGMLLTRRLERLRLKPVGFVATEYALSVWGMNDLSEVDLAALFDEDMLGDDLDAWLADSAVMKRNFRDCAVIAGLIERNHPGKEKSGRQIAFSSDLIYEVLREHEPDHVLLQAAWADAAGGFLDLARLGALLARIKGRIVHAPLQRVSPMAVPVMLEIGREPVYGEARESVLIDASDELIEEATRLDPTGAQMGGAIRD